MRNDKMILEAIRALVKGVSPEIDITDLLYIHRCYYLLAKLKQPHKYTKAISESEEINRIKVIERYKALHNLFYFLKEKKIPYAVIKGAVLSNTIYGDCYLRRSGDVDILMCRENVEEVKQYMEKIGFIQGRITQDGIQPFSRKELLFQSSKSHQIAPFVKCCGEQYKMNVEVDINLDIMWGESEQKADMGFVLENTDKTVICGTEIKKLTNEMEFIALCLHHYKDMNSIYLLSKRKLSLSLFLDIYLFIKNGNLNVRKLYTFCVRLNVTQYVYYCLYYTDLIFDDNKVKKVAEVLKTPEAEKIIDYFGLTEKERHKWDIDFVDRLFETDINKYFEKVLTPNQQSKIEINKLLM